MSEQLSITQASVVSALSGVNTLPTVTSEGGSTHHDVVSDQQSADSARSSDSDSDSTVSDSQHQHQHHHSHSSTAIVDGGDSLDSDSDSPESILPVDEHPLLEESDDDDDGDNENNNEDNNDDDEEMLRLALAMSMNSTVAQENSHINQVSDTISTHPTVSREISPPREAAIQRAD